MKTLKIARGFDLNVAEQPDLSCVHLALPSSLGCCAGDHREPTERTAPIGPYSASHFARSLWPGAGARGQHFRNNFV